MGDEVLGTAQTWSIEEAYSLSDEVFEDIMENHGGEHAEEARKLVRHATGLLAKCMRRQFDDLDGYRIDGLGQIEVCYFHEEMMEGDFELD